MTTRQEEMKRGSSWFVGFELWTSKASSSSTRDSDTDRCSSDSFETPDSFGSVCFAPSCSAKGSFRWFSHHGGCYAFDCLCACSGLRHYNSI